MIKSNCMRSTCLIKDNCQATTVDRSLGLAEN